jgi:WXG100 family type VII secretion target
MAYTIRLTPSDLRNRANDIQNNAAKVKSEVAQVTSLLESLKKTFIGESAAAFFKDFENSRADMEQWDDIVLSFANELNTAARNLEQADKAHH